VLARSPFRARSALCEESLFDAKKRPLMKIPWSFRYRFEAASDVLADAPVDGLDQAEEDESANE